MTIATFPSFPSSLIPVGSDASPYSTKDAPAQLAPIVASKGDTLTGYAAVWLDDKGQPYIDSYNDMTLPGSWKETIRYLDAQRRSTRHDFLIPHLFNHSQSELIGGVKYLAEDSKGVIYETKLARGVRRADEAYELARNGMLGTSYGYNPTQVDYFTKGGRRIRKLVAIMVSEISSVVFPANPYTTAIAKARGFPAFPGFPGLSIPSDDVPVSTLVSLVRADLARMQQGQDERRAASERVRRRHELDRDMNALLLRFYQR